MQKARKRRNIDASAEPRKTKKTKQKVKEKEKEKKEPSPLEQINHFKDIAIELYCAPATAWKVLAIIIPFLTRKFDEAREPSPRHPLAPPDEAREPSPRHPSALPVCSGELTQKNYRFWLRTLLDLEDIKEGFKSFASPAVIESYFQTEDPGVQFWRRTSYVDGNIHQEGGGTALAEVILGRHYTARSFFMQKQRREMEAGASTVDEFIKSNICLPPEGTERTREHEKRVKDVKDALHRASRDNCLESEAGEPALSAIAEWNPRQFKVNVPKGEMPACVEHLRNDPLFKPIVDLSGKLRRLNSLIQELVDRCRGQNVIQELVDRPPSELSKLEPRKLTFEQLRAVLQAERDAVFPPDPTETTEGQPLERQKVGSGADVYPDTPSNSEVTTTTTHPTLPGWRRINVDQGESGSRSVNEAFSSPRRGDTGTPSTGTIAAHSRETATGRREPGNDHWPTLNTEQHSENSVSKSGNPLTTFDLHAFYGGEHNLNSLLTAFDHSVFCGLGDQSSNNVPTPFDFSVFFEHQQDGSDNTSAIIDEVMYNT